MEMEKDSKIFVAGHKGLLGSAVHRTLVKKGHTNLLLYGRQELDLLDQQQTFQFFEKERPEYVFVCAAKVGGILANSEHQAQFLYENLQIQNNLIEGAHRGRVKKLLFVGSTCIYPVNAPNPITEDKLLTGPLEPTNEGYAVAKLAGIKLCQYYREQYGNLFISAIPTNLYGPNDRYDLLQSHFLPALILKIHKAKKNNEKFLHLWGTGAPRREYMYSDDCASALYEIMQRYHGHSPINVGTGVDHSIKELAELAVRVLNADLTLRFDQTRPDGIMRKLSNVDLLKKLGWHPEISLEEGIKRAYEDFLLKHGQ